MKDEYRWRDYVVASIDFLGQKDYFKKMQGFYVADVSEETREYVGKNTVDVVDIIRAMLHELFEESEKPLEPKLTVPEKDKDEYGLSLQTAHTECRVYSDSILAYIELAATGYQRHEWSAISDLFHLVGGALLGTLSQEASFRAAIELGIGIKLNDGDLYGPIRAKIWELEESADYPRIVIGKQFFEYMMSFSEGHPRIPFKMPHEALGCKNLADKCRKMIAKDPNDGRFILDYLRSDDILKSDSTGEYYDLARKYIDKVLQERHFFENDKVVRKFLKLRNYFDSRPRRT